MQDALNEMQRLLTDISDDGPETYVNSPPRSPDGGSRVGSRRAAVVDAMSESMDILKRDEEDSDTENDAERDSDGLRYSSPHQHQPLSCCFLPHCIGNAKGYVA
jgi:hypothetical protein